MVRRDYWPLTIAVDVKLIIQIPCLNEAEALPETLSQLPRELDGFDRVEWLVVDDGSTDATSAVARASGADHIVRLTNNKGLAAAFQAGLDAALKLGADVIVNTDADNQYVAADIPKLVAPIRDGRADMVVGDRRVDQLEHFTASKRLLQRLGSWVVRRASGTTVPDTTSGFRAYNREAALQLLVVSNFTYTLESLIQAGKMLVAVEHVPIRSNPQQRESRLFESTGQYVRRNALAIFRAYVLYEPLRVFTIAALAFSLGALAAWSPFLIDWVFNGDTTGHVQSLILGAVLAVIAVQMFGVRRLELELGVAPSHLEPAPEDRGVRARLKTISL
jgi:glycosyltransferase involved in cell wall biosynthesis